MKIYDYESNKYDLFIKTTDALLPDVDKESILLFDIATTSFEAANGCVFLIGAAYLSDGKLMIKQLFSENVNEEVLMINEFISFADRFKTVLSYKGDSFDFPYLSGRLSILCKDHFFAECSAVNFHEIFQKLSTLRSKSFDLFNIIKPLKTPLGFVSTKLDYLQKRLGQNVFNSISGENISVFYSRFLAEKKLKNLQNISTRKENLGFISDYFIKRADDELAHLIIRGNDHFLEDILANNCDNLEAILFLCRLSIPLNILNEKIAVNVHVEKKEELPDIITFIYDTEKFLSKKLCINLQAYQKNIKLFYADYKNYFYFPLEDMAVHRSVAEFTSTSSRKKATKETAFRRVSGLFFKVPESFYASEKNKKDRYKENYESKDSYLPVNGPELNNIEFLKDLAYHVFLEYARDNLENVLI